MRPLQARRSEMNPESSKSDTTHEIAPASGSPPAPVWLFVLLAVLAFWGLAFLDNHAGGFEAMVYAPYKSKEDVGDDWFGAEGNERFKMGKAAFSLYCAPCHQESGLGNPANQVPPQVHSEWVLAESPNRLIRIVLNGLRGPVTVDGKEFNSDGMLPWRDTITDDEVIADILTYVRQNDAWGHHASEVTAEQVAKIREETKGRSVQWTVTELLQVPEK
jgi:mono/diheme cytochrome c family protein